MLQRKNDRVSNKHNWKLYRKQRNLCTQLRKQSIRTYMLKTCTERKQLNGTVFWDIVKLLILIQSILFLMTTKIMSQLCM